MKILAHRGCWGKEVSCNSPEAIRAAIEQGYGFESDVRDYMEKMVISHNIADASCQDAEEVFRWLHEFGDKCCFAINIKADGLKDILKEYIGKYKISNYFLFDMSVPQMVEFRDAGLRFYTRQSEVEPFPNMYDYAAGIWIDGFWSMQWITEGLLGQHIANGKEVCLVSPELHGNPYEAFWKDIKKWSLDTSKMSLCTDYPDKAKEYFYGE